MHPFLQYLFLLPFFHILFIFILFLKRFLYKLAKDAHIASESLSSQSFKIYCGSPNHAYNLGQFHDIYNYVCTPGPSCSKLMMLLVNESLKF